MARSLKARLGALEQSTQRKGAGESQSEVVPAGIDTEGLPALGFHHEHEGNGSFWHRRLSYDLLSCYGNIRYQHIVQRNLELLARACKVPNGKMANLAPEQLRFYDTETTGLGTGAGTFPFLHAIGQIEEDEWVIHQYFVDDFSEEPALLAALVKRHFARDTVCVNFNGKSFDWPLFRNRLVMYRIDLEHDIPQLDLLHPSRRLWRRKLERVSLGHLEEAVMGVHRLDDLPGREAPARYFAYVDNREVGQIRPVLDHNAADVSALLGLTVVLADLLNGDAGVDSAGEYAALAKWYDEWQEYDLAEQCWSSAIDCPDATWREFWLTSLRLKRLGNWIEACSLWQKMALDFSWTTGPLIELAKYYEHRERDYGTALKFTEAALERAERQAEFGRHRTGTFDAAIEHDSRTFQGVTPPVVSRDDGSVIAALRHRSQRIARKAAAQADRR